MIGCFAMTELGHSSFLRGAETTATFDLETQEFIINTPTLTATKWWIGAAGQTATHTLVLCQLTIKGENHGLQWYFSFTSFPTCREFLVRVRILTSLFPNLIPF
jgi:acyl-CoA oxidase